MSQPRRRVLVAAGNSGLASLLVGRLLDDPDLEVCATYRRDPTALFGQFEAHGIGTEDAVVRADLTVYNDVEAAIKFAGRAGPLWGVINLAGTSSGQRLAKMDPDEARGILLDNCLPALYLTKASIGAFRSTGLGGRVIHVSSVTSRRPVPGVVPYVAGKAAVEGIVRASAEELGRVGGTINALRLGYFDAGMSAGVPESILEGVIASTASRRLGTTEDLLAAVMYLLSPQSGYMNGSILDFDGGLV